MFNTPEGNKILRYGSIVLIILAIFLATQVIYTLVLSSHVEDQIVKNVIAVNGTGDVLAKPDIATFSFGAEMIGETVASAQKVVSDRINKSIDILKKAGVDEKDIKTIGYNIYPHYESTTRPCTQYACPQGEQKLTGYQVTQTLEVKVRDTAKAGEILGSLGTAEITNVSGINFTIDKPEDLQAEAEAKAIADAKSKAQKLAKSLGVHLGKVVSFSDSSSPTPIYMFNTKAMDSAPGAPVPQIPVGQNTITSNVSVTYEIE